MRWSGALPVMSRRLTLITSRSSEALLNLTSLHASTTRVALSQLPPNLARITGSGAAAAAASSAAQHRALPHQASAHARASTLARTCARPHSPERCRGLCARAHSSLPEGRGVPFWAAAAAAAAAAARAAHSDHGVVVAGSSAPSTMTIVTEPAGERLMKSFCEAGHRLERWMPSSGAERSMASSCARAGSLCGRWSSPNPLMSRASESPR